MRVDATNPIETWYGHYGELGWHCVQCGQYGVGPSVFHPCYRRYRRQDHPPMLTRNQALSILTIVALLAAAVLLTCAPV